MSSMSVSNMSNAGSGDDTATFAVGGLVVVLAIISVILRFYTRVLTRANLWWDDWLILASVLVTVTTAILIIISMVHLQLTEKP